MTKKKLTPDEIKALVRTVCICNGIKMKRICEAIEKKGCQTVEEVNGCTGSGSGACKATRCRPVIEEILKNEGKPVLKKEVATEEEGDDDDLFF